MVNGSGFDIVQTYTTNEVNQQQKTKCFDSLIIACITFKFIYCKYIQNKGGLNKLTASTQSLPLEGRSLTT